MDEIKTWKQIKDYSYEVSTTGEIRNIKNKKILKQRISTTGYWLVDIQINKVNRTFKTHRLIAETFLEKDLLRNEVDHINRIKHDNRVENLRWVSHFENMQNVDWDNTKRNIVTKEKILEISKLLKNNKNIDEIYNLINTCITKCHLVK